jgi:hypothetical protein
LEYFISQIEENIEYIKEGSQKISDSPKRLTSIFDEIFSVTFYVEKEKKN